MRDAAKADSPYAMPINDFVTSVTRIAGVKDVGGLFRHNCACNLAAICATSRANKSESCEVDGDRGTTSLCD